MAQTSVSQRGRQPVQQKSVDSARSGAIEPSKHRPAGGEDPRLGTQELVGEEGPRSVSAAKPVLVADMEDVRAGEGRGVRGPRAGLQSDDSGKEIVDRSNAARIRPAAQEREIPVLRKEANSEIIPVDQKSGQRQHPESVSVSSAAAPTVRINIGRVSLEATQPEVPRRPFSRPRPSLSLDEYLKQRKGRRHE